MSLAWMLCFGCPESGALIPWLSAQAGPSVGVPEVIGRVFQRLPELLAACIQAQPLHHRRHRHLDIQIVLVDRVIDPVGRPCQLPLEDPAVRPEFRGCPVRDADHLAGPAATNLVLEARPREPPALGPSVWESAAGRVQQEHQQAGDAKSWSHGNRAEAASLKQDNAGIAQTLVLVLVLDATPANYSATVSPRRDSRVNILPSPLPPTSHPCSYPCCCVVLPNLELTDQREPAPEAASIVSARRGEPAGLGKPCRLALVRRILWRMPV